MSKSIRRPRELIDILDEVNEFSQEEEARFYRAAYQEQLKREAAMWERRQVAPNP